MDRDMVGLGGEGTHPSACPPYHVLSPAVRGRELGGCREALALRQPLSFIGGGGGTLRGAGVGP